MKLLMAGDWQSDIFEEPLAQAFEKCGIEIICFKWYLNFSNYADKGFLYKILSKIQDKYMIGYLVKRLNRDLLSIIKKYQPKILFLYRGSHIEANTLKKIRILFPKIYIISYNNDDPFSTKYPWWQWRHFNSAIPYSDLLLSFRHSNIPTYYQFGAKKVDLFRGYYNPSVHKKLNVSNTFQSEFECDVIFIGHYEDDGRAEVLEKLAAENIKVKIFGPNGSAKKSGWDDTIKKSIFLKKQKVRYLKGIEYVTAINKAKIGLCFMSKLNNDTYTLRCFEIPACGTALFSEWTEDLANLFDDGVNAVLFKTKEELLERVKYYLSHPKELSLLAERGTALVKSQGHDVFSRASWLVNKYSLLTEPGKLNPDYT